MLYSATIYDYETAMPITEGLQTARVCDEAIIAAKRIAKEAGKSVVLEDSDGMWIVDAEGYCEEMSEAERRSGGWIVDAEGYCEEMSEAERRSGGRIAEEEVI